MIADLPHLLIYFAVLLLVLAAGWDLASYTIPNFLSAALIAVFAVFAFSTNMHPVTIGFHVLVACLALFIGFALFALGYMGGGDAKLFAAVALWLGLVADTNSSQLQSVPGGYLYHLQSLFLLQYMLFASVIGGALTLALIGIRQVPLPALLMDQAWVARLHAAGSGVPYGVALAAGALIILLSDNFVRCVAG